MRDPLFLVAILASIAVLDRIRTGTTYGAVIATIYALWVLVVFIVHGTASFTELHVTFGMLVLTYYVTGIFAGALVGALAPLVTSKAGAFVVGWIAGFFVCLGVAINMFGFLTHWRVANWVACAFTAVVLAAAGVSVFWTPEGRRG